MTEKINVDKVYEEVAVKKAFLLDVRSEEEFAQFSLPNSLNLNIEKIEFGKVPSIPRDAKIYVYCMSGSRSKKAVALLKLMGFTKVKDAGGIISLVK